MMTKSEKQKNGKIFKHSRLVAIPICVIVAIKTFFGRCINKTTQKRKVIVLDTDMGTDDAVAFLAAVFLPDVHIDYVVASKGNASLEDAARNAIILKNYLGLDAKIVQGQPPKADANDNEEGEKPFHGIDGLAGISDDMIKKLGLTSEELDDYMTYDKYHEEILNCDEIEYILIGPATNLANSLDDAAFTDKLTKIYIMGGGINEFNCSHDTEFNFSQDPQSVIKVLESGKDITLFPLDLTNHCRVTEEQIDRLEEFGTFKDYISFLRFNRQSNSEYNGIDAAVIHDIMPLLYLQYPEEFVTEEINIEADQYGATRKSENGKPVKAAIDVKNSLLNDTLIGFFRKYDKRK